MLFSINYSLFPPTRAQVGTVSYCYCIWFMYNKMWWFEISNFVIVVCNFIEFLSLMMFIMVILLLPGSPLPISHSPMIVLLVNSHSISVRDYWCNFQSQLGTRASCQREAGWSNNCKTQFQELCNSWKTIPAQVDFTPGIWTHRVWIN